MVANLHSLALSGVVHLPVGLWVEGTHEQDAEIHELAGRDEELIGEASRWSSPAARVSALLVSTISRIGRLAPLELEHVRALSVLDRDVLLMFLRRRLFGDRIQSTVRCPQEGCGKLVDIDFKLGDVPLPDRSDSQPRYEIDLDGQKITFRLPSGGDQEVVAAMALDDLDSAARQILQRCVNDLDRLTPNQATRLRAEMDRRDVQLNTDFDVRCPECGSNFSVHFDIQDFLLREISAASARLYRQVHTLAWYYHWSEAEILAMPLQKRHMYLDLLSDAVSEFEEAS